MPDAYRVELVQSARRELESLHEPLLRRVLSALRALAREPRPHGCRRLAGAKPRFRIRVGDYRIVYAVDDGERVDVVYHIRPRDKAYD